MSFRLFSFSLLISLGALLGHTYLYKRLVHDTVRHRAVRLGAAAILVLFTLLLAFRRTVHDALPLELAGSVTTAAFTWMGLALFLVQAVLAVDLGVGLLRLAKGMRRARPRLPEPPRDPPAPLDGPEDPERRRVLTQALAGAALVAGGTTAVYGRYRAFASPDVTEVAVRLPGLPRSLDGLSIVQVTDVHVGPFIRRPFMDHLVERVNALKPDLVAITGDLVDGDVPTLGPSVAALANLRARFGRFFVTGNHEYYSGEEAWVAYLEQLGVEVLRNRRVAIGDAGGTFDLVGVDDWSGGRRRGRPGYDLARAIDGRDRERAAVLLAHQPANFREAAAEGIGLQLSGHTHGGQLFPMTMLVGLQWEHVAGLYREAGSHLYVSRGCGFWGPPMRVGSPPELVKVVLTT